MAVAVVLRERTVTGIYDYGRNKEELRKRPEWSKITEMAGIHAGTTEATRYMQNHAEVYF